MTDRRVVVLAVSAATVLAGAVFALVPRDEPRPTASPPPAPSPSEGNTPPPALVPPSTAPAVAPAAKPPRAKPIVAITAPEKPVEVHADACGPDAVWFDARDGGVGATGCRKTLDDGGLSREGHWTVTDIWGETSQGRFVDGRRDGRWFFWRQGKLVVSTAFKQDQRDGYEVEWDESGRMLVEREWRDGLLHGRVVRHEPDGSTTVEEWRGGVKVPTLPEISDAVPP